MIGLHSEPIFGFNCRAWWACVVLFVLLWMDVATIAAADPSIHVELNAAESVPQNHCRLTFVVENSTPSAIDTLKLDLAMFDREGVIQRRMVVEMGPIRSTKTIVRTFNVETDCGQVGAILLNEVTACAPEEPATCLDRLTLSSRSSTIRFYK